MALDIDLFTNTVILSFLPESWNTMLHLSPHSVEESFCLVLEQTGRNSSLGIFWGDLKLTGRKSSSSVFWGRGDRGSRFIWKNAFGDIFPDSGRSVRISSSCESSSMSRGGPGGGVILEEEEGVDPWQRVAGPGWSLFM